MGVLTGPAIIRGVFETSSGFFRVGYRTAGEGLISVFQEFSASVGKLLFWHGDWALDIHSVEFRHFLIFPNFLRSSATRIYHVYK